jgi:hypothetical protein
LISPLLNRIIRGQLTDDSPQTLLQGLPAEIDQQADLQVPQPDVGQGLFRVHKRKLFDRFQFDHHAIFHQQIDLEPFIEQYSVLLKANDALTFNFQTTF